MARWDHLLCSCPVARDLAARRELGFLPAACRQLGVPLALYTMSHYVALFIWHLLLHVAYQHRSAAMGSLEGGDIAGQATPTDASSDWLSSEAEGSLLMGDSACTVASFDSSVGGLAGSLREG